MSNYISYPCSCIICKKTKTSKGIHSHYLISHTVEGGEKNRKNRLVAGLKGSAIAKQLAKNALEKAQTQYLLNPKRCKNCNDIIAFIQKNNKFCSSSCSASFYNKNRKGVARPDITKQKISVSINQTIKITKPPHTKIKQCTVCGKFHPRNAKTCSDECYSELLSIRVIDRIKQNKRSNYRRDKKSYLEQSFEKWMIDNNIELTYIDEYTIKNHLTRKWYFVDFYFPDINLIVELDGKQHEKPKHKQADNDRDEYIESHLGIKVFRISYDEYQAGSKIEILKTLLVPRPGNAPGFTG